MNNLINICLIISKYILPTSPDCCFGENPRELISQDWALDILEIDTPSDRLKYAFSTIPDALKILYILNCNISESRPCQLVKRVWGSFTKKLNHFCVHA